MRIVTATDTRALNRLIAPSSANDRRLERRVRAIVRAVRAGGDRALERCARRFDGTAAPLEVSRDEMREEAARVDVGVRRAIATAARHIARVAFKQIPRHLDIAVAPGVAV